MKYIIDIDIPKGKIDFAEDFFKSISFVKNIKAISNNEITNIDILHSIEEYEQLKTRATPLSLSELKAYIDA